MNQAPNPTPGILVLRPTEQAEDTLRQIEQQGWHALHFPTIEIVSANAAENAEIFSHLEKFDWIIFVSQNAVTHFRQQLSQAPEKLPKIAAVGKATAAAVINAGWPVALQPGQDFSSEGLLNTVALQHVNQQQILIIRGNGGRELLAETLAERGATVSYAEVYARCLPDADTGFVQKHWSEISVILATSNQLLDNLITLVGDALQPHLFKTPVVVISPRMQKHAEQLGFDKIWLADGPTNDQMIETIKKNILSG